MRTTRSFEPELERELLRRGVGHRARSGDRCADCGRAPLIGERVYHYEGGPMRCELCRPMRKEQPARSELVHGPEHGNNVVRVIATRASMPAL